MNAPLSGLTALTTAQWQAARVKAEEQLFKRLRAPDLADYTAQSYSQTPRWVTLSIVGVLSVVAALAFFVSAGKEIASAWMLFAPIVKDYSEKLSPFWADGSSVSLLVMGELATIAFTVASGLFPEDGRKHNRWFICIAWLSAGIAFAANASITISHEANMALSGIVVFGWLLTFLPPIIVLGIGLSFERILMQQLEARVAAKVAYEKALSEYNLYKNRPEAHEDFLGIWCSVVYDALHAITRNKALIDGALEDDPNLQRQLVQWQFDRFSQWQQGVVITRPTTAPSSTGQILKPSLTTEALSA